MKRPFDFASGTAIVTGAACGIGEELTYRLARRGSAVALVDRDAERLGGVARAARALSRRPVTTMSSISPTQRPRVGWARPWP